MELKTLEKLIINILKRNKRARADDFILYGSVLKEMGISFEMTIYEFLATAKLKNMPPFESVTRCRRKIQSILPELKDEVTAKKRKEQEKMYKEYSR